MELNHIDLPASVIADLYHSSIIDANDPPVEDQPVMTGKVISEFKWLGENRKNILIIVQHPDHVHLPDKELDFLTAILAACKIGVGDVAILNLANCSSASYKELIPFFKSRIIFLFAVEPASFGLPMNFPHFQVQTFANNSFLFCPSLHDIEEDRMLKSKLWVCLRKIFNI